MELTLVSWTRIAAVLLLAFACTAKAQNKGDKHTDEGAQTTIEGLVRDISCPIQNKEATATTFNLKCALQCARRGSPLIILAKDGIIYIPISDAMPDKDQRQRLMPFVGKYVKATGKVFEREGTHAIAIEKIAEMKDVHLVTDAR
jgi:hypothetical protein